MDRPQLEAALRRGDARLVGKLLKVLNNIAEFPEEEQYRSLRLDKPAVRELLAMPGAEELLRKVGFGSQVSGMLYKEKPSATEAAVLLEERQRIEKALQALLPVGVRDGRSQGCAPMTAQRQVEDTDRRLLVFDFDSTITVHADFSQHGLSGERRRRLLAMADALQHAGVHCVLVTAQVPVVTESYTLPVLQRTGLARLFVNGEQSAAPDRMLYRRSPATGGVYNGMEAFSKLPLIGKIIAGENRWSLRFAPERVLFVDDRPENLQGHEQLGISALQVAGDGMSFEEMSLVETFAATGEIRC